MDTDLATAVLPYVAAVAAKYGTAVLDKLRDGAVDAAADGTVELGRRILAAIFHRGEHPGLATAVEDVAEAGDDPDAEAALRRQLRKALAADPALAGELTGMLQSAGVSITASGE